MPGHHAVLIRDRVEARQFIKSIGTDKKAPAYMEPKAVYRTIKLKNISCQAANLIKQEMLSKGGEAAVSKETIFAQGHTDALLMGTIKHYRLLIKKLKLQPFGLKKIAEDIQEILDNLEPKTTDLLLADGSTLNIGDKTLIMGILNVTPDSFSDGGQFNSIDQAVKKAIEMVAAGADIIDVGGASSRPDTKIADEDTELERVLPVVKELAAQGVIISVDTFRASVAKACLEVGGHLINDIGRLMLDETLLPVLVEQNAPVILMHNRLQFRRGEPYEDLISDIVSELQESINLALEAGVGKNQIIIDPGLGFGKTLAENRLIIKRLWEFKSLGFPILLGASRKSFIGQTLNVEIDERKEGSLAVATMGIMNGADILRVHDVEATKRVVMMTDAVVREDG
ncbi:MAG TPA: dihydropteroate synthase [Syntrophomonadaceae bacterium]|nr:dihydropteroate synthase [Syntrophomonadaceae bacterium]